MMSGSVQPSVFSNVLVKTNKSRDSFNPALSPKGYGIALEDLKEGDKMMSGSVQPAMFSNVLAKINKSRGGHSPALSLRGCEITLGDLCAMRDGKTLWQHMIDLMGVTHLDLAYNKIDNLNIKSFLDKKAKKFFKVESLDLSYNKLETLLDLKELIKRRNIESFTVSNNNLHDISDIKKCTKIKKLYASNNKIYDISDIKKLKCMTHLDLSHNQLKTLLDLRGLTKLEYLNVSNNQITDILGLNELKNLKYLNISNTNITIDSFLTDTLTKLKNSGATIIIDSSLSKLPEDKSKSFDLTKEKDSKGSDEMIIYSSLSSFPDMRSKSFSNRKNSNLTRMMEPSQLKSFGNYTNNEDIRRKEQKGPQCVGKR